MELKEFLHPDFGKCVSISNGTLKAAVTIDFGPRIIHLSLNLSGTALDLSGAKLQLPQSPALLIPESESPRLFRRTDCPRAGFYLQ